LEQQCSGSSRLESPFVGFAADAAIEHNAGSRQELSVVLAKHALANPDLPALSELGQPPDPGQMLALDGGVYTSDEQNINVAWTVIQWLLQERALTAEQALGTLRTNSSDTAAKKSTMARSISGWP